MGAVKLGCPYSVPRQLLPQSLGQEWIWQVTTEFLQRMHRYLVPILWRSTSQETYTSLNMVQIVSEKLTPLQVILRLLLGQV
jgi:hypothetical protein